MDWPIIGGRGRGGLHGLFGYMVQGSHQITVGAQNHRPNMLYSYTDLVGVVVQESDRSWRVKKTLQSFLKKLAVLELSVPWRTLNPKTLKP